LRANWGLILVPSFLLGMVMLIFPQVVFLRSSFFEDVGLGLLGDAFSFANYVIAFSDPYYTDALKLNLMLSTTVVFLTLMVSFPVAYTIARMTPKWAMIILAAIIVSAFVSVAIKILGIIILFGGDGAVVKTLKAFGIIGDGFKVIGTMPGVIVGLTHLGISFMVLMLFSVIQTVPRSFEEAAEIHGAVRWRVYWRVIIPLSLPGLVSTSLLLFNIIMGAFVSALVLGGGKILTFPVLIQQSLLVHVEYGMSATLSSMLLMFVLVINLVSVFLVTRIRAARLAVT
jgi:putative spermidine/putrescine transport system permease protein